jgi:hypothetical protein
MDANYLFLISYAYKLLHLFPQLNDSNVKEIKSKTKKYVVVVVVRHPCLIVWSTYLCFSETTSNSLALRGCIFYCVVEDGLLLYVRKES